ncbi:MAG TPA: hypothetical protein DEP35_22230 [Deltaproteobacteria bacterium]|jgi:hypothetical protein|nr:hypothetical protein [Deltaproteobacteria bacterium]
MMARRVVLLGVAFFFALNAACGGHSHPQSSDQPAAKSGTQASSAKAAEGTPPPPGSPLAKIQAGMSDAEVQKILGEPDNRNFYPTGKGFIPFYYGGDTARTDWIYKGKGRVVFSHNRWSGSLQVVRVDYNPNETGK